MSITQGGSVVHWMIGTPIRQVRLPRLANELFQRTGRDEVLVPMEVHADGLAPALALYAAASNAGGLISTLHTRAGSPAWWMPAVRVPR